MRAAILLAGPIRPTAPLVEACRGRRVIAADGGIAHAAPLGLAVDLWVGDFDSTDPALAARHPDVPQRRFPRDKDRTDGEIAIEAALDEGADDLLLVGALRGPRTDHAFMHLVLLLRYAAAGHRIEARDGTERALPLTGRETRLACQPGTTFSLLKFGDLDGLTITGARWPLADVHVPFHSILTQSNEALGAITVGFRGGPVVLILQEPA